MGFATDLLGGYEVLYKRTEGVLKVSTEMAAFFRKLSVAESEYSKVLVKLTRGFSTDRLLANPHVDGTVKEAWAVILRSVEDLANKHEACSQQLMKDFSTSMTDFVKDKEVVRKRLTAEGLKQTKDMKTQMDTLARAKTNYMAKSKEAETAQGAVTKEQSSGANAKKLGQLQQKSQQANEKAAQADQEYQDVLRQTNTKQNDFWQTEMPNLLNEFQQFEEERISFTKNILVRYGTMSQEMPAVVQHAVDNMAAAAEKVDHNSDINGFVSVNKTGATPPPPIDYQSYDNNGTPSSPTAATSPPSSGFSSPSASSNNKFGAYRPTIAITNTKDWGLSAKDASLTNEQKAQKLEGQLLEIDLLIKSETGQKGGVERLLAMYGNDPVAYKKTEAEIAEFDKRISELNNSKKNVQTQLATVSPQHQQEQQQQEGGGEEYAEQQQQEGGEYAEQPTLFQVRGLFDYEATCETELSFKENEIMNITEQHESGWWYANVEGRAGFVPQNYVEKI